MLPTCSGNRVCGLEDNYWNVFPDTGIVSLTDEALKNLINPDPIEKWYQIDSEPIARGQFTVVYHCRNLITESEFAAKFSSRWRLGVDCSADLEHEIAVCAILRQPIKAVQLVEVFSTDAEIILILEYAPGGDLQTLLDQDLVPFERNVIAFMKQILETLAFIHEKNIVHLDIKPQNLVLMGEYPDCEVKLCDFEISRILVCGRQVRDILGTADYIAPEIIHYEPITTKADMWSFGILTYVLLTGFLPFGGDTDQETFLEITRGKLDFPEELFEDISDQAIDFIKRLLLRQPHLRMSAKECLNHEWIKSAKTLPKINITSVTPTVCSTNNADSANSSCKVAPLQNSFNFTTGANAFSLSVPSSPNSPQHPLPTHQPSITDSPSDDKFDVELKDSLEGLAHSLKMDTCQLGLSPLISQRETGLPPPRSYMSNRTSNHSSTSSLSRGGSKQSLDRIRSISKSREILFERLQKSSQRKLLSRSRERLYDSRFGIYLSRDELLNNRSISHSVETLPPSDLTNDDLNSFYSSSGNVCALPVFSMLPLVEEHNSNCRQYRSMAAINNIDGDYDNSLIENRRKESVHSNFTYATKGYDNLLASKPEIITKQPSAILKHQNIDETKSHENKSRTSVEEQRTVSRIKDSIINEEKMDKIQSPKRNTDKGKKDIQKRRKEREKNKGNKMKENHTDIYNNENDKKVKNYKGSGYNIEQRIQIRRTRKNKANPASEKKVNNGKQCTKSSEQPKKIVSSSNPKVNNKTITIKNNNNCPKDKKLSSLHNASIQLDSGFGVCANKPLVPFSSKIGQQKNLIANNTSMDSNSALSFCKEQNMKRMIVQDRHHEIDEAYSSLEDPLDDAIEENKHFAREADNSGKICDSSNSIAKALQLLNLTDTGKVSIRNTYNGKLPDKMEVDSNRDSTYGNSVECRNYDKSKDLKGQDLTVIAEEEETVSITSYVRSVSTCSDISSVLSEFNDDILKMRRNSEAHEVRNRRKSLSMHTPSGSFVPDRLSRSKSLHLDTPLAGKVRPWGDLCSGSIDRAYSVLRQKSSDFIFVPRKNSDPTSNRPKTNGIEKNSGITFKNRLLKV